MTPLSQCGLLTVSASDGMIAGVLADAQASGLLDGLYGSLQISAAGLTCLSGLTFHPSGGAARERRPVHRHARDAGDLSAHRGWLPQQPARLPHRRVPSPAWRGDWPCTRSAGGRLISPMCQWRQLLLPACLSLRKRFNTPSVHTNAHRAPCAHGAPFDGMLTACGPAGDRPLH